MMPVMRRTLLFGGKLVFTCLLLAWIIGRADLGQMRAAIAGCRPGWIVLALSLHCVGLSLSALRWRALLLAHGINVSVSRLWMSYLTAMFFNFFLPGTVGGDVVRAYDVKREKHSGSVSAGVVLFERVMGVFTMLVVGFVALALSGGRVPVPGAVCVALSVLLAGVVGVFGPVLVVSPDTIRGLLGRFSVPDFICDRLCAVHGAFFGYRGHKSTVLLALFYSVLLQLNVIFYFFFIGRALGLGVGLDYFFMTVPVAVVIVMIPVTINGIGLSENVWAFLLAGAGVSVGGAVLFSWMHLFVMLFFAVAGGVVYLAREAGRGRDAKKP